MNTQTLGKMISSLRKEKGMTQLELAEKMGVTDKAVSKWERELSIPDVSSIPKLAEVLGVSVEELMQGKTETEDTIETNRAGEILDIALKGIGMAMGIAVMVLSALGELETKPALAMLGIGLASVSMALMRSGNKK